MPLVSECGGFVYFVLFCLFVCLFFPIPILVLCKLSSTSDSLTSKVRRTVILIWTSDYSIWISFKNPLLFWVDYNIFIKHNAFCPSRSWIWSNKGWLPHLTSVLKTSDIEKTIVFLPLENLFHFWISINLKTFLRFQSLVR